MSDSSSADSGAVQPLGDERDPAFTRLWVAGAISSAGTAVTDVALPMTFVALHATSFEFGLMFAFKTVPRLFAPLFAAPIVDRYPRRWVLILCDLFLCFALATIPIAVALGQLAKFQIYAVALALGLGEVLAITASRAYLPSLVKREALATCNARLEAGLRISGGVVPGLAGGLVKLVAAPLTIAIDCISYLVSAILLLGIRRPEPPPVRSRAGFWAQLREGWTALLADHQLRTVVLSFGALMFGAAVLYTQLAHYIVDSLHLSSFLVGCAVAAWSFGALVGALIRRNRSGGANSVLAVAALLCAAAAAVQAASGALVNRHCVLVAGFLLGLGSTIFMIYNVTMRQLLTPMHLQGRVSAIAITLGPGLWPIGAIIGGVLGEQLGLRTMFGADAVYFLFVARWIHRSSLIGHRLTPPASHHEAVE